MDIIDESRVAVIFQHSVILVNVKTGQMGGFPLRNNLRIRKVNLVRQRLFLFECVDVSGQLWVLSCDVDRPREPAGLKNLPSIFPESGTRYVRNDGLESAYILTVNSKRFKMLRPCLKFIHSHELKYGESCVKTQDETIEGVSVFQSCS